jgi:prophage regulatory protein
LMRLASELLPDSKIRPLTKHEADAYLRAIAQRQGPAPDPDRLLRKQDVVKLTGVSSTTIWRLERKSEFPGRVQLSPKVVAWRAREVLAWIVDRKRKSGGGSL